MGTSALEEDTGPADNWFVVVAPSPRGDPRPSLEIPAGRFDVFVFDMDGVVTDTAGIHGRAWQSRAGVEIMVVTSVDAVAVDRILAIRPQGPGRVHLCAGGGREVIRIAGTELTSAWRGAPDAGRADGVRWIMADWWHRGIGSGLVGVAADPTSEDLRAAAGRRATFLAVDAPMRLVELLDDQLERRRQRRVPAVDQDPAWTLILDDHSSLPPRC